MKSDRPFWLDGGYDFDSVQACRYHPAHKWMTVRLGDVLEEFAHGRNPDERLTICAACYVPRCGSVDTPNRCALWRHHRTAHVYEDGTKEPLGGLTPAHGVVE